MNEETKRSLREVVSTMEVVAGTIGICMAQETVLHARGVKKADWLDEEGTPPGEGGEGGKGIMSAFIGGCTTALIPQIENFLNDVPGIETNEPSTYPTGLILDILGRVLPISIEYFRSEMAEGELINPKTKIGKEAKKDGRRIFEEIYGEIEEEGDSEV